MEHAVIAMVRLMAFGIDSPPSSPLVKGVGGLERRFKGGAGSD
jgi:hypothetical protein